jgi:L-lactate utilization protein LutB
MFLKKDIEKDIYRKRSKIAVEALKKNEFDAFYVDNSEEALNRIIALIPDNATIGIGGSVTIREIGLAEILQKKDYVIFTDWDDPLSKAEKMGIRKAALNSDVYLTSSNAITLKGQLVNIDGTGNRVAAMIFGPKKVIIVAGVNKIVDNLDEAFARIRNIAGPLNGKRLNLNTPCALTGRCTDCQNPQRMCKVSVIIEKKPNLSDITVIIIGESLGY